MGELNTISTDVIAELSPSKVFSQLGQYAGIIAFGIGLSLAVMIVRGVFKKIRAGKGGI